MLESAIRINQRKPGEKRPPCMHLAEWCRSRNVKYRTARNRATALGHPLPKHQFSLKRGASTVNYYAIADLDKWNAGWTKREAARLGGEK